MDDFVDFGFFSGFRALLFLMHIVSRVKVELSVLSVDKGRKSPARSARRDLRSLLTKLQVRTVLYVRVLLSYSN